MSLSVRAQDKSIPARRPPHASGYPQTPAQTVPPAQIDHSRQLTRKLPDLRVRSHRAELIPRHRKRARNRKPCVHRDDLAVHVDGIRSRSQSEPQRPHRRAGDYLENGVSRVDLLFCFFTGGLALSSLSRLLLS